MSITGSATPVRTVGNKETGPPSGDPVFSSCGRVETGAWNGPDLKPAAAKKIVTEALEAWAA